MKVKDLMDKLRRLDPELDVLCFSEDEALLPPNHMFRLLDIEHVSTIDVEKSRGTDGIPSFKIGRSDKSTPHAIIEVVADF